MRGSDDASNAMTCTAWFELVSAAADDQLSADEQARLDAHLAGCASCRSLLGAFERERRRRRMAPPVDRGDLVSQVLDRRALDAPRPHPGRELARRSVLAVAVVVAFVLAMTSTHRATPTSTVDSSELAASAGALIDAEGQTFDDAEIEIQAGTTVEWRNTGTHTHHLVRSLGGAVVSEDLAPGHSEVATFAEPGTYEFWCTIHRGMTGTVTVDA